MSDLLLKVKRLGVEFYSDEGVVRAVDRVSFDLQQGEILGIVGESGSGKSVTSLAVMGLLPTPPARISSGEILFQGKNLLALSSSEIRALRGKEISIIFQDPFTALNPYLRISTQLMEVLETHSSMTSSQARHRCLEVLDQLGVPEPEIRFSSYPHQLSGGLKQRMMIAMSLLLKPKILIADEPTTALDVTIQAQILELLKEINRTHGTSIILITHDLGVVAGLCNRVAVMYGGRFAEHGSVEDIYYKTRHPYTEGLMRSIPSLNSVPNQRLQPIPGVPPDLTEVGDFCAFYSRCFKAQAPCSTKRPPLEQAEKGHFYECYFPLNEAEHLSPRETSS